MKIAIWGRQCDHVGESPFWDAEHGCLWSVDMTAQAIRRRWPDGRTDSFPTAELPAALALNPQGDWPSPAAPRSGRQHKGCCTGLPGRNPPHSYG